MSKTKYLFILKAETNDKDYIHLITYISKEELKKIQPIINTIKSNKYSKYNWVNGFYKNDQYQDKYQGILPPEQLDYFNDMYVPHSGFLGIHTIKSITVYKVTEETTLL